MLYLSSYYGIQDVNVDDVIKHHGILGQKWGKRNGPPYPLKSSAHSSSEKKAGWRKSLSKDNSIAQSKKIQKPKVSSRSDVAGIGAEAAALLFEAGLTVAYVVAVNHHFNKKMEQDINENVRNNNTDIKKKIKGKHTEAQDQAAINPDFNLGKLENSMNCTMCTTAYELRRRGYDVEANVTTKGRRTKDTMSWFNLSKADVHSSNSYDAIKKELLAQPEGSRGNFMSGVGPFDSRHSMVWERKGNDVVIRDCQSNTVYDSIDTSIVNKRSRQKYEFYRSDNAEINWETVKDAVVERKERGKIK